jgi:hypothetical protein
MRARLSKYRNYIAAAVILFGIVLHLILRYVGYLERGYEAIGGEFMVLLVSPVVALIILDALKDRGEGDLVEDEGGDDID